jgi:hypothetical protein
MQVLRTAGQPLRLPPCGRPVVHAASFSAAPCYWSRRRLMKAANKSLLSIQPADSLTYFTFILPTYTCIELRVEAASQAVYIRDAAKNTLKFVPSIRSCWLNSDGTRVESRPK